MGKGRKTARLQNMGASEVRGIVELSILLVLSSVCVAQAVDAGVAKIRAVKIIRSGKTIRVIISLSKTVTPEVDTAVNPDRLVLDLPNVDGPSTQRHWLVNRNGVDGVRIGLNRTKPPVTRAVVDLDSEHPYTVVSERTRVILIVQPTASARGPLPAAQGTIW